MNDRFAQYTGTDWYGKPMTWRKHERQCPGCGLWIPFILRYCRACGYRIKPDVRHIRLDPEWAKRYHGRLIHATYGPPPADIGDGVVREL